MSLKESKMSAVQHWFYKQAKRQNRISNLSDALLGSDIWNYLYYRIKFFSLNTLVSLVIHLVEALTILRFLPLSHALVIFLFRILGYLVRGAAWGGLEILRERIRHLYKYKQVQKAELTIGAWTMLMVFVLLIIMVATVAFLLFYSPPSIAHRHYITIYLWVVMFDVGLSLLAQVFHAGALAIKRVYRPFWSISLPMIIALLVLVVLAPIIKQYALVVSMLIFGSLSFFLNIKYSLRALSLSDIHVNIKEHWMGYVAYISRINYQHVWIRLFSGLLMRADAMLVLFMLYQHAFLLFYLILPLLRSGFKWPRLFYYDFIKLRSLSYYKFESRFSRHIILLSIIISIVVWLSIYTIMVCLGSSDYALLLALLLFLITQGVFSLYQLISFCMALNGLIVACCLFLITASCLLLLVLPSLNTILIFSILFIISAIIMHTFINYKPQRLKASFMLDAFSWAAYYKKITGVFYKISLIEPFAQSLVLLQLPYPCTCISDTHILLYHESALTKLEITELLVHFSGNIRSFDFNTCLNALFQTDGDVEKQLKAVQELGLVEYFKKEFQQGLIVRPGQNNIQLKDKNIALSVGLLNRYLRIPLSNNFVDQQHVSALFAGLSVQMVFIIPDTRKIRKDISRWQALLWVYALKHLP